MPGRQLDFAQTLHASTKRDYLARVVEHDKAESAEIACRFDYEYWDGDRRFGYGGYTYDGRWRTLAQKLAHFYQITPGDRVLDIGCGKGYLLYELMQVVPGITVSGIDISAYAIEHAKSEVAPFMRLGNAARLPYADNSFDIVTSLGTLHNLHIGEVWTALEEIERIAEGNRKYLMVESYRNEREKMNLLYWQLTCKTFLSVDDWVWLYGRAGYRGDHDFIFFT